jgi:triacylglycerol esterase/lipase EstA (alpha/beta hydrolase family)
VGQRGHPVLLVPGFSGQDLVYWNLFRRRLEADGLPAFTMRFPGLGLQDIEESSDRLARRVDEVLDATGADELSLIGHSLGGLVIRDYVQEGGGSEHVNACATLGTPHQGTLTSLVAIVRPACRQMLPGSGYLENLNQQALDVPFVNVYSKRDPLVVPHSNARFPAAENHRIRLGGHWGLLIRRAAYDPIVELIGQI